MLAKINFFGQNFFLVKIYFLAKIYIFGQNFKDLDKI